MTKKGSARLTTNNHSLTQTPISATIRSRKLFMVDDHPRSLQGFIGMVEQQHPDWQVEMVHDGTTAMKRLREMAQKLPDLISVDLGLEPLPDATDIGLDLLRQIRKAFSSCRLAVHSALNVEPAVLHEIVGLRASYIRLRDRQSEDAYALVLPWLADGCLFFTPSVAEQFSDILPQRPDPLDDDEWDVARLLAKGKDYEAVAEEITKERYERTGDRNYTMSLSRVQVIVREIAEKLSNSGFITVSIDASSTPNRYKPLIITFYNQYHVKYRY